MTRLTKKWAWTLVAVLGATSTALAAEPADAGAVSGVGTAKVDVRPELARVRFDVSADGSDVKDALAKLREKEKAVRAKLAKLGVPDAGVTVEEPRLAPSANDQQAQMEQMIRARTGRGAAVPKPTTGPAGQSARVTARVKAEWPLAAKTHEDLLVESQELAVKIKAADLTGAKEKPAAATPEQQEEAEERALRAALEAQQNGENPGGELTPQFVSRVTPEAREKLFAEAYAKAKAEAAQLAKAAGSGLGAVKQLQGTVAGGGGMDEMMMYRRRASMFNGGYDEPTPDEADPSEAVGTAPGKITYRVTVNAAFAIK